MSNECAKKITLTAIVMLFVASLVYFVMNHIKATEQKVEIKPDNGYSETLVAVADTDYEPYSFLDRNGNPSGYDIELLYALANEMKVNIEVRLMNWTDCKAAMANGEADLITGLDYQHGGYPNIMLSRAVLNDSFVCFGRENFANTGVLYHKRLATIEQSGCIPDFLEPYRLIGNTTRYPTYTEAIQSVIAGENDYAIALYSVGRRILAKLGETEVRAVGPSYVNNAVCIGVKEGNAALVEILNAAIETLTYNGTVEKLADKWLGTYVALIGFKDFLSVYSNIIYWVVIGIIIFLAVVIIVIYHGRTKRIHAEQAEQLKQKELELTNARVEIMLSQIQPHFMYNTLNTIENLCYKDGKLAASLVNNFSHYLRENMDALGQKELVRFERELEHLQIYVAIEKLRFEERLHIVYDFETTDFSLPILTVQPLVENAVRYGITKKTGGGTVTISTRCSPEGISVIISDDGVGFDPEQLCKQDGRSHVGIENVRERLRVQCGGNLTVNSIKGEGTVCIITAPHKEGVLV